MLVYGAQLCSSLTVTKLSVPVKSMADPESGLLSAQLSGATGLACTQGGAAYTNWIKAPHLPELEGTPHGISFPTLSLLCTPHVTLPPRKICPAARLLRPTSLS